MVGRTADEGEIAVQGALGTEIRACQHRRNGELAADINVGCNGDLAVTLDHVISGLIGWAPAAAHHRRSDDRRGSPRGRPDAMALVIDGLRRLDIACARAGRTEIC